MAVEIIIKAPEDNQYADAQFERRPHGTIFIGDKQVGHSMQCPHCNAHFLSRKGSGAHRSWCNNCAAVTCGKKECVEKCAPWEKQMCEIERRATQALRGL